MTEPAGRAGKGFTPGGGPGSVGGGASFGGWLSGGAAAPAAGGMASGGLGAGGEAQQGGTTPIGGGPLPFELTCDLVPEVMDACPGEVAAGGGGGGGESADGGAAMNTGAAGAPVLEAAIGGAAVVSEGGAPAVTDVSWCGRAPTGAAQSSVDRTLIDDLEDADDLTPLVVDRGGLLGRGSWFVVNDGSGRQFPSPCTLPSPVDAALGLGGFAMRTYGKGFQSAPGGYSLLGISIKSGVDCDQPLDASRFTGVEFRARGSGVLRFFMGTVETNPVLDFGTCQGGCYDSHGALLVLSSEWQSYRVPFTQVVQEGWGTPAPFDSAHILTLQWSAKATGLGATPVACFDFWIDDVALYR